MKKNHEDAMLLEENDIHIEATYRLTEALVEAENRMHRRVQLLSEIVFETDTNGKIVFLNKAWAVVLGYDPAASISHLLSEYVFEKDRPRFEKMLASPCSAAEPPCSPVRFRRSNGELAWMDMSVSLLDGGGFVGVLHDVTRLKRAQEEVAKLSLVASSTDNLVIITDRDGVVEWANPTFTKRTGYSLEEVVGQKLGELLQGPDTDSELVAQIGEWVREGRSFQAELLNYTKSGEPYWASFHVTPVRDKNNEVQRFISVQTDSTQLRRTQGELRDAEEKAESSNSAKRHFLAMISHEMRTPLNAILGHADLALEDNLDLKEIQTHVSPIRENAEILLRLISDLLDVAKIEAGQIDIEHVPFRLQSCLLKSLAPMAVKAKDKKLQFRITYDETLPKQVMGDPNRLRQILTNLAENAIKFTDDGGIEVFATRESAGVGKAPMLKIRVVDTGIGISAEAQSRIFQRFEQADTSITRRKGGAGLGLGIVKSLVSALGGEVLLSSSPNHGTDVCLHIPMEMVSNLNAGGSQEPAIELEVPSMVGAEILVAEDTLSNFVVIDLYLCRARCRVERAVNGLAAVDLASRKRYDLVLMDVEMPEMDGIQATRLIREKERQRNLIPVPILALTAHVTKGYHDLCMEAGCTGYLSKPIRKQELLDAIAAALEKSRLRTESANIPVESNSAVGDIDIDADLASLVPEFLEHCQKQLQALQQAVARHDLEWAARIGHDLKGCAPTLGFDDVGDLGRAIESHARRREESELAAAAERLGCCLLDVGKNSHV